MGQTRALSAALKEEVSSGARNLTEYLLVFCPHLQVRRPAGCVRIFSMAGSQGKRLLLPSGRGSATALSAAAGTA